MSAPAVSRSGDASTPTARQATTKVATWHATTTIDATTTMSDGADGSERLPQRGQLAPDRGTGAPVRRRRDDDCDAGDDDHEKRGAHSGSVGRHSEDRQHHGCEDELHRLTGRALRRDRARRLRDPPLVEAMRHGPMHVADDAARQDRVEELRAVVRRHRLAPPQRQPEAPGEHPPPPGRGGRGHRGEHERRRDRRHRDRGEAPQERLRADGEGEREEDAAADRDPHPRAQPRRREDRPHAGRRRARRVAGRTPVAGGAPVALSRTVIGPPRGSRRSGRRCRSTAGVAHRRAAHRPSAARAGRDRPSSTPAPDAARRADPAARAPPRPGATVCGTPPTLLATIGMPRRSASPIAMP